MTDVLRSEHERLQRVYRGYAPVYDRLFARLYQAARARSIASLHLSPNARVLLLGAGTGLDLRWLPADVHAVGVDMNAAMLARARSAPAPLRTDLIRADAQAAPLRDGSFDAAILHLILSVAPDPAAVISEAARCVRPGCRIAVIDVFAPGARVSPARRAANMLARALGTDITRNPAHILAGQPVRVISERRELLGMYRAVLLERV